MESIIMAHQIRTISKQRLENVLGYLDDSQLRREVDQAIRDHLDMD